MPLESSLQLSDFDYSLPPECIAQTPLRRRDQSRLLVLNRACHTLEHRHFIDLPDYLCPGDTLVLNDTRVTAQRLYGARPEHESERIEVFLTHRITEALWQGLARPGKKALPGTEIVFPEGLKAEIVEKTDEQGGRLFRFSSTSMGRSLDEVIASQGQAPLPPYITQPLPPDERERYQTVYASHDGSAAAPTAGLHFTPELLRQIRERGVSSAWITLHVGIGTFRPIRSENIREHTMHPERVVISEEAAEAVNATSGRVIAVGTTSARSLESAAIKDHAIHAMDSETSLYVTPGYQFKVVDGLITNFHMPRSTLLVLVSALAGREFILSAYEEAIRQGYRFLSFGDAMLIL